MKKKQIKIEFMILEDCKGWTKRLRTVGARPIYKYPVKRRVNMMHEKMDGSVVMYPQNDIELITFEYEHSQEDDNHIYHYYNEVR